MGRTYIVLRKLCKIAGAAIGVTNRNGKVKNVVHHTSVENILEKLIVVNGTTRVDF
jgi:hypothetical protein